MNHTHHIFLNCNSNSMTEIADNTVNLIVTSPPYPMIEMWDELFGSIDSTILDDINTGNEILAYKKMNDILNKTWHECDRVLAPNGFVCINIGDAVRTFNDNFRLFSNHTEIINTFLKMGYTVLPDVHWRKPSNAPNKFMGSGMYPAGAYVTYEHEYILIFRKGGKRIFKGKEKEYRQKSAYFWEERNSWFSDLWEIKGTKQSVDKNIAGRSRNASYPLEVPYRLVNMYSVEHDTVLDPFSGMGTTSLACILSKRNSIGVDISKEMIDITLQRLNIDADEYNNVIQQRLNKHIDFISSLETEKKEKCYMNNNHGFLVKTRQETAIQIEGLNSLTFNGNILECEYCELDNQLSF